MPARNSFASRAPLRNSSSSSRSSTNQTQPQRSLDTSNSSRSSSRSMESRSSLSGFFSSFRSLGSDNNEVSKPRRVRVSRTKSHERRLGMKPPASNSNGCDGIFR